MANRMNRDTYTSLVYPIIFGTKNRRAHLSDDLRPRIYSYIGGIMKAKNCNILSIGGTADHVHLLLSLPSQISVAEAVRLIKSNSSKWLHETFETSPGFAWQAGYAALTVSLSQVHSARQYIENQEAHHRQESFRVEFEKFLAKHGIELWNATQEQTESS